MNIFNTLRGRIIALAMSAVILAVGIVFWQMDHLRHQSVNAANERLLTKDSDLLQLSQNSVYSKLYAQQFTFTRNDLLKQEAYAQNSAKVSDIVSTTFKRLAADQTITFLQISDKTGTALATFPKTENIETQALI